MRKIFSIMLLCATVVFASCKTNEPDDKSERPVTGVKVDPSSVTLGIDQEQTVKAIVSPLDADNMTITWSSSDPAVATVNEQGSIKAIKVGTAVITATSNADKTIFGICNVTITAEPTIQVSLNKTTLSLAIDATETLVATVTPENTPDKSVTWTSSATDIATVSATGEVKAIKVGLATITATSVADNTKKDVCAVTVTAEPVVAVSNVSLNKTTLPLLVGASETLVATVTPENVPDKSVTWTSSATDIATVSATGEVKAIKAGLATITATSVADNTKKDVCAVTVTAAPIVEVSNVSLNKTTLPLLVGASETLVATVTPENAPDKNVVWSSDATDIATVSATGEVKAIKAGTATITATSVADNTKKDVCAVTVTAPIKEYAVGDLYPDNKSPIGIVFWVNPTDATKGKIISMVQEDLAWSTEKVTTGATSITNGAENSAKILALGTYTAEKYPALALTKKISAIVGINWYLPSKEELNNLFTVKQIISRVPGAGLVNTTYWSSTEVNANEAWIMNLGNGGTVADTKNLRNMARSISTF